MIPTEALSAAFQSLLEILVIVIWLGLLVLVIAFWAPLIVIDHLTKKNVDSGIRRK